MRLQIKVGSEREPYWLQPEGESYAVVDRRPAEPPFATEYEARQALAWFTVTYPGFAYLLERFSGRSSRRSPCRSERFSAVHRALPPGAAAPCRYETEWLIVPL